MKNVFLIAVLMGFPYLAHAQELPRPRLPCQCNVTGVCNCLVGECKCVACRLSKEKRELSAEVQQLKAELQQLKAELQRLKARPAPSSSWPSSSWPSSPWPSSPGSPPPVYHYRQFSPAPSFGVPVQSFGASGGDCPT